MIDALCGTLFGTLFMTSFVSNGVDTELPNCCKLHHIVHFSPIGYIALKFGCSASSVFYISIFFTLIAGFVRFLVLSESDWLFIEETYKGCFISCSRRTVLPLPLPVFIK